MPTRHLLIAAVLLLGACAHQPIETTAISDWQQFAARQQQLTDWRLEGKLGFRAPDDSGSAFIDWQQQQQLFDLHLSGALGFGATRLSGSPEHVVMTRGDDTLAATNSTELTYQLLGMALPVESLTYWVKGIPDPNTPVLTQSHGDNGELTELQQAGWQLTLSRYQQHGDWLLPGRISGQRNGVSFKLIIKEWQPQS